MNYTNVKPFIKWAGGKSQLLNEIRAKYPENIDKYCEPFVGGGAVLLDVLDNCHPSEVMINDINPELTNTYAQIKNSVYELIEMLSEMQARFWGKYDTDRKVMYLANRERFNEKKRDPEAHSVKRGNQWHFGYKAHIGVDKDTGLVHTIKATSASKHDVTVTSQLLHGEEKEVYGDSGYIGAETRSEAIIRNKSGKKIKYKISRKPSSIKKLSTSGQYFAKKQNIKNLRYVQRLNTFLLL